MGNRPAISPNVGHLPVAEFNGHRLVLVEHLFSEINLRLRQPDLGFNFRWLGAGTKHSAVALELPATNSRPGLAGRTASKTVLQIWLRPGNVKTFDGTVSA